MSKLVLFALLGLLLVACGTFTANHLNAPKKATPPEGKFANINGTNVHYVQRGSGPDLILIHGAGGSSREWTFSMMDKLVNRYTVTAIDRPGHGYTDRIKTRAHAAETLKEQADLVYALAGRLGIEKAIVTGQSYGGGVASSFAVHHPDKLAALVMVAAVSNPWSTGLDQWYETTNTFFGKWFLIPTISLLTTEEKAQEITKGIFEPNPVPEGYLTHMGLRLSARPSQIRANTGQINRSLEDITAQSDRYGEITVPVEIIHGTKDTTVPLDVHSLPLVEKIEGANLVVLDGVGHMPQHSHEAEVIAAIDRAAKRAGLR